MSISERVKALCDLEGSISKFAEKTGIKRTSINRVVAMETGLRSDTIYAIAQTYPKLNIRWLITGEGEMWHKEEKNGETQELKEQMLQLLEGRVKVLERELKRRDPGLAKELGIE